jgi:3-methyladenine DNA glycosylase AlkD
MRSEEPFLGVRLPEVRRIVAVVPAGERRATAEALWDGATHREERYAAIALLERGRRALTADDLPLLERLIAEGAWWDLVDPVAKLVGLLLPGIEPELLRWARADDMWRRRAAIICQRSRREATDLDLLRGCIEPSLADREFFLRKAIGWALRSYAYTDPLWVDGYVRELGNRLSPLSRREATKHLSTLLP